MTLLKTFFILFLITSPPVFSASYEVGDKLEMFSLTDQYDKAVYINNTTQLILFSRDKAGGKLISNALSGTSKEYFTKQHIVYITDISRMPSFISNYIAIPLMRKKRYPILLDKEGKITAQFPDRDNTATLIFVESLKIKNIKYLQSVEEIVQLLKLKQDN